MGIKIFNKTDEPVIKKPYIIVIEGLDGAGKATTTQTLFDMLKSRGYRVKMESFPMYNKWHSFLVRYFLKGKFGKSPYSVPPRLASLFYSIDRLFGYHSTFMNEVRMEEYLQDAPYDFIIFDRYTTASMVYQGAKGKNWSKGIKIAKFIEFVEYKLFRLPKPNKVFVLVTTAEQSKDAMKNRKELDINEADLEYQKSVRNFLNFLIGHFNWFPIATRQEYPPYEWYPSEDIAEVIYAHIDHWALAKVTTKR